MKNKKREVKNKVIAGTLGMMTSMFLLSTTVMAAGGSRFCYTAAY